MATTFTFIADRQFRASVESDQAELNVCIEHGAWKAAHVLAGSIVEALLVETLLSVEYKKADPHKMTFDSAIEACAAEKIITSKTAGLTNVVREYRNLIHPGRVIRLKEAVTEQGARIAAQLVDLIAQEVARFRQGRLGYTADQIVSKLEKDTPAAASILPHLLRATHANERERLLLEVIPMRHNELNVDEINTGPKPAEKAALERCFHLAMEGATPELRAKVSERHVRIITDEDREYVLEYCSAFFRSPDIHFIEKPDRELVVDFLLSEIEGGSLARECFRGLATYVPDEKVAEFVRHLLHMAVINKENHSEWQKLAEDEVDLLSPDNRQKADKLVDIWINHYREKKKQDFVDALEVIKHSTDPSYIPF